METEPEPKEVSQHYGQLIL